MHTDLQVSARDRRLAGAAPGPVAAGPSGAQAPFAPARRPRRRTGFAEWAQRTTSIGLGCGYNCLYCCARGTALLHHRISSPGEWARERVRAELPRIPKCKGWVLFPSGHDITPRYLDQAVVWLRTLLEHGNRVLVVTKPRMDCVARVCGELEAYKKRIRLRFTITSVDPVLARFWEPGAPEPQERLECLRWAYRNGWRTSVSAEPLLAGADDAVRTVKRVLPFVKEGEHIWIGTMNNVRQWVFRDTPAAAAACRLLKHLQSDAEILRLVEHLRDLQGPRVLWKDSIREVIRRHRPRKG